LVRARRAQGFWTDAATPTSFTPAVEASVRYFQQTHLGRTGTFLDVDGVVGPDTWWSLANASGPPQRSGIDASIPKRLSPRRARVLEIALGEHARGVSEKPNGSNRGPEVDKYLPAYWSKRAAPGPAWCCFFYSWVVEQALGAYPLRRRQGSCARARADAGALGLWKPKGLGDDPIPGDAFVMDRGAGKGHIGFVVRVARDGATINTVEGNCGNRVKVGLREVADPEIVGFIDNVPSERPTGFERGVVAAPRVGGEGTR
jgi:hypothetical protein